MFGCFWDFGILDSGNLWMFDYRILYGYYEKIFFELWQVRLQIPLFSEQDNFLLKRGLRIIF